MVSNNVIHLVVSKSMIKNVQLFTRQIQATGYILPLLSYVRL